MEKKMYRALFTLLSALLCWTNSLWAGNTEESSVFATILSRMQTDEWESIRSVSDLDQSVTALSASILPEGSWNEIDYDSKEMTNWPSTKHLENVVNMCLAYTCSSSKHFEKADLYQKIESALRFFYDKDPQSANWYVHQIGNPQRLGRVLMLMRSGKLQIPGELEDKILARIRETGGSPYNHTGANKVDVAIHWVYQACLTQDASRLASGVEQVYYPLFMTTEEGLQHDFSYFQHGQQLYTGGYGVSFVRHTVALAGFTLGTEYALSREKSTLLIRFFRDHFLPTLRQGIFLYNTLGRRLAVPGGIGGSFVSDIVSKFEKIDPEHKDVYQAAKARLRSEVPANYRVPSSHHHYWRADYTLYSSPAYTFDIRMATTRTSRSENGNGENMQGYFLTEGANAIVLNGDEYRDIFPVWNWARIPGTTLPQKAKIPRHRQWEARGNSLIAGGVSNGRYGVTTYVMDNQEMSVNTKAKKSWFMFGEEIVCLGAGISSTAEETINTTLNQCRQSGAALSSYKKNETYISLGGSVQYPEGVDWIHHNKIAYFFPKKGNVQVSFKKQTGTWNFISNKHSTNQVSNNAFTLWIDHGVRPVNDTYEYLIVPNKTVAETRKYDLSQIVIAENTESIQAVQNKKLDLWGLVFHEPTSFSTETFSLSVDAACVVMLENPGSASVKAWIADPSQQRENIKLRFWSSSLSEKEVVYNMPKLPYAGSSIALTIDGSTSTSKLPSLHQSRLTPNPVKQGEVLELLHYSETNSSANLLLNDLSGKQSLQARHTLHSGENRLGIDTYALLPGWYVVSLIDDSKDVLFRNKLIVK